MQCAPTARGPHPRAALSGRSVPTDELPAAGPASARRRGDASVQTWLTAARLAAVTVESGGASGAAGVVCLERDRVGMGGEGE